MTSFFLVLTYYLLLSIVQLLFISLVCNTDSSTQNTNIQPDDKCLAIQMAIPLQLSSVHSLTPDEIKATFQPKFDEALEDGSFVALLPPEVQNDILGVSPSLPGNDRQSTSGRSSAYSCCCSCSTISSYFAINTCQSKGT